MLLVCRGQGVRGNCSEEIIKKFELRDEATAWNKDGADPQSYGLGIKEVWEIDPAKHVPGKIVHTMAWPLDTSTYGGSFLYHAENNQVYMVNTSAPPARLLPGIVNAPEPALLSSRKSNPAVLSKSAQQVRTGRVC